MQTYLKVTIFWRGGGTVLIAQRFRFSPFAISFALNILMSVSEVIPRPTLILRCHGVRIVASRLNVAVDNVRYGLLRAVTVAADVGNHPMTLEITGDVGASRRQIIAIVACVLCCVVHRIPLAFLLYNVTTRYLRGFVVVTSR